ncbi:hypothetical protein PFMALIP_04856 [Plasmodium falciparum MaliPS096_E11]|uniref:Surface antigen n=1 Tax=Plasmodium falciparum MaliPS096_E11 TaxID=1036727 RepID=A0A024WIN0_PLAFA|nr:hypothetical protein PFMALIP_04856 [Plasmodium falciparum MaliPS096_E11]
MKVHCYNILLFSFTLIILLLSPSQVNNQMNHYNRAHMKNIEPTKSYRSLYECGLYSPANNDNDPEMKRVMQQFEDRTSQRFLEYDERMQSKRMQCKEQCDKEIQKIILKDKLEKQMEQQLTTLETKIDTDDIPTCVCEKSLADKVEKGCLRCGYGLGTVAPTVGLIGAVAVHVWKPLALKAAIAAAIAKSAAEISAASAKAGNAHGMKVATFLLEQWDLKILGIDNFGSFFSKEYIIDIPKVVNIIATKRAEVCGVSAKSLGETICNKIDLKLGARLSGGGNGPPVKVAVEQRLNYILGKATDSANAKATQVAATEKLAIETTQQKVIEAASYNLYSAIGYSILAILIIVLIMVIIYLVLRYRRKEKMKKKLQYIKLLEE